MRAAITFIPLLLLAGCDHGSEAKVVGQGSERSYQVAAFDSVSLAGPHDVIVKVGGAPSVRAVGDKEALDRLEIRVEGSNLVVGEQRNSGFSWGSDKHKATIYVTVPALTAAAVAGSGDMSVDKVEGDRFEAAVGGSGELKLASVRVGQASFSVAGSGDLDAAGMSKSAKVSLAGSGSLSAANFQTGDAKISIAGSGSARLKATGTADVTIVGSGDAEITGGAKCSVTKIGSGHASCTA